MPRRREGPVKHKQSQVYFFDEYIGFPPNKERIRFSLSTKDPEKAWWLWEREYKRQWAKFYGEELKEKPKTIRFSEFCSEYIDFERDIKKIKEWKMYSDRLKIINEVWGDPLLHEIKNKHFVQLDRFLKSKNRSEKTINHYFTLLKGLFNFAIKKKLISGENPVKDVNPYITKRHRRREYTPEEIARILKAAGEIEEKARKNAPVLRFTKRITLMLLYTAMRPNELFKLRWSEHIKDDMIVLGRTETKQKKEKIIPITSSVRKVLDSLKDGRRKDDYVFPKQLGNRVYLTEAIRKIREKTGIQDFIFYNLKHTAATIMVAEALGRGASLTDVMKVLGHSRIETTMQYVHDNFDRMKMAMEALEDMVDKSGVSE